MVCKHCSVASDVVLTMTGMRVHHAVSFHETKVVMPCKLASKRLKKENKVKYRVYFTVLLECF